LRRKLGLRTPLRKMKVSIEPTWCIRNPMARERGKTSPLSTNYKDYTLQQEEYEQS
jgi:hypothetical protein